MSSEQMKVEDWIKERRTIHAAAVEGPWLIGQHAYQDDIGYVFYGHDPHVGHIATSCPDLDGSRPNATAIVDAHNTLPTVLTALEKVLELHRPVRGASRRSPDVCAECDALIGEPGYDCGGTVEYPCPTVQKLQEAINDE